MKRIARFTAIFMAPALLLAGSKAPQALTWDELAPVLVDKNAAIPLPNGKRVEGEVLAVRPDGIVMDIRKTRDKQNYPTGQGFVPRDSVNEVRLVRHKGPMKLALGIAGTVGGVLLAGVVTFYAPPAGIPMFILAIPSAGVGGYYAGKAADRRTTLIKVIP